MCENKKNLGNKKKKPLPKIAAYRSIVSLTKSQCAIMLMEEATLCSINKITTPQ
jgi:hypothetical protein